MFNPSMATKLQKSASLILGSPIEKYVSKKRRSGSTWREIARELYLDTGGKVDVTDVTLIRWMGPK